MRKSFIASKLIRVLDSDPNSSSSTFHIHPPIKSQVSEKERERERESKRNEGGKPSIAGTPGLNKAFVIHKT